MGVIVGGYTTGVTGWCLTRAAAASQVRELFEGAGKAAALGPLDENCEEDDEELEGEDGDDALLRALAKAAIS